MDHIKSLLVSGNLEAGLEQLQQHLQQRYPDWEETALLLKANYADLEQHQFRQTLEPDEIASRRNRLLVAALEVLESIETGDKQPADVLDRLQQTEGIIQTQNTTRLSDVEFKVEEGADVVIGSGNKIFRALGRWQFWVLLLAIAALGTVGFFFGRSLASGQADLQSSFEAMRTELLAAVADQPDLQGRLPEFRSQLDAIELALQEERLPNAIAKLKQLADQTGSGIAYKELAHLYEANGQIEKAYYARYQAEQKDPSVFSPAPANALKGKYLNLLAPENGGELLESTRPNYQQLIDGSLNGTSLAKGYGIYSFAEDQLAEINRFDWYVQQTNSCNATGIVLQVSTEAPDGPYTTVDTLRPRDAYSKRTPLQEFEFEPVRVRYLKLIFEETVKPNCGSVLAYELRVWGRLK